jgi:protein-tyrosine phosphatase
MSGPRDVAFERHGRCGSRVMTGFVDIHSHILPGIDDGPEDLAGALRMARAATESGIATVAATPHLRPDFPDVHVEQIAARCQALRDALDEEQVELDLVCGAEVSLSWALEATDEELRQASYGQRGTDLLVEAPFTDVPRLADLLFRVRSRGFRVTLAHPERSETFQRDRDQLRDLARHGMLLQINASSLRGDRRRSPVYRLAAELCLEGLAHAIASDAHRATDWRAITELRQAAQTAAGLVGPARAHWLTRDAPAAALAGTALPMCPNVETASRLKRSILRRSDESVFTRS